MPNRVIVFVAKMDEKVKELKKSGKWTDETEKEESKKLDMPMDEYCHFQTLKSGMMGTALTTDEAQTLYAYLGETPEHFNKQRFAVKLTLSKIFAELLEKRIKSK